MRLILANKIQNNNTNWKTVTVY